MARVWTKEQSEAINARGSNLLLAAAAGSGKTAVLVERIIKKITDEKNPIDVDKLLVLTFTNAAAAEMRERVVSALSLELLKNPDSKNLSRQLTLVSKANITTIHSFCNELLRTNFNLAGIDPNFRIPETTENDILRIAALDEIIDEMYEDEEYGEAFAELVMSYSSVKTTKGLFDLFDSIYAFCMSLPNPEKWLADSFEMFRPKKYKTFNETPWAKVLLSVFKKEVERIIAKYDYMVKKAALDDGSDAFLMQLESERERFCVLLSAVSLSDAKNKLDTIVFETAKSAQKGSSPIYRKAVLKIRDSVKKDTESLHSSIFNLNDEEQLEVVEELYPIMRALSEVVLRFIKRFDEKKEQKNLLNFNDLEHKTLKILLDEDGQPTLLANSIKEKYEEILIDEYQDISRLQEAIFSAIKRENNLFMVGDLKQSIYRFRNTDPMLFKQKKDEFKASDTALDRKIILSKNFRSRSHILDCINFIFSNLMTEDAGEIDYGSEEMLYFGADYQEDESLKTEVHIVDLKEIRQEEEDDSIESVTAEAYIVAQRIADLIKSGEKICTKDGERDITYKDICILMRSTKSTADVFASVLSEYGIPCYSEKSGSLFECSEIETILSFLRIIDNPYQDIPLISVLRSQIYAFTTNDLAKIRVKKRRVSFYEALVLKAQDTDDTGRKSKIFIDELISYRDKAGLYSVAELIWHIYMQTGFYDYQLAQKGGELKQKNLRLLYTKAQEYEATGVKGLYNFISFIDEYTQMGITQDSARAIGEEHDVVRIMSIHKSKGLEFPVVFVSMLGKQFNKQDIYKNVVFHPGYGYGPKYFDVKRSITYPNGVKTAIEHLIYDEMISEEMRIMYVALTRAKERLILTGSVSGLDSKIAKYSMQSGKKPQPHAVLKARSYLDWVIMCLLKHPDGGALRDRTDDFVSITEDKSRWSVTIHDSLEMLEQEFAGDDAAHGEKGVVDAEKIIENISWQYPYQSDIYVPSKVSVSEIKRRAYESEEDTFYMYKYHDIQSGKQLTAAQKGIAVHTVMEKLDFKSVSSLSDIEEKIKELKSGNILSADEVKAIDKDKVFAFFASPAGELIKKADKIYKEAMFGINIDAKEIEKDYSGDAKVMLQGIIDCILVIGEKLYILDYKTDKVDDVKKIVSKYKIQLDLYKKAAEKIYKKPVDKKLLYLFDVGELIEV